ncbi:hypothetical protein NCS57_01350600 [Fusarium keratoplasticum]|uniref:Uncharacterized protein n=1 Tax=Fusarium keratoplasticum TaxID=1328300 RepID=A0ACC0QHR6_9HYPO|nr:hypothetical protein NCS57_01350600 [Fusarium keratoplasticum]KAI8652850.1 hypothetical protein NCS57_01350600 [Fusarium keratoplasticum]
MAGQAAGEVQSPARLPDDTHHVIVKLETIHVPAPAIDLSPLTHELITYEYTPPAAKALIAARIHDASIVTLTTVPINAETLGEAPYLKCVISETTGTNHIDLEECKKRNITVMFSPHAATEAVSEHALGLYFSVRRSFVRLHNSLFDHSPNAWASSGSMSNILKDAQGEPPHTCGNEIVGILGFGALGQRIARLCEALGMKVLVAARKEGGSGTGDTRIAFDEVLRRATVLFITLPLTPQTRNTIGSEELQTMRRDAVLINVGRGGLVDETALVQALRQRLIHGAATDVFEHEPAGSDQDSVLLSEEAKELNLTLTPHLAWCADQTTVNMQQIIAENLKEFLRGGRKNVVSA